MPPVMPVEVFPAPVAAQRVYERGSIAEMIQTMFREADERAAMGMMDQPSYEREGQREVSDPEAFRLLLETLQSKLKESDAVNHLKQAAESGHEISEHDVEAVFRAYERALHDSLQKLRTELSPAQLHRLQYASTSELDWSLRDLITRHVAASAEHDTELHYSPADFFLILNPKARKIEYMESSEILGTLRRSMSLSSKDQLKRDLQIVHQSEALPAVQEFIATDDFPTIEKAIT